MLIIYHIFKKFKKIINENKYTFYYQNRKHKWVIFFSIIDSKIIIYYMLKNHSSLYTQMKNFSLTSEYFTTAFQEIIF